MNESVAIALQAMRAALSAIRDAHAVACDHNQLAQLLLLQIIEPAQQVTDRLADLREALTHE